MVDPEVLTRKTGRVLHHCARLEARANLDAAALHADEDIANTVLMDLQQAIQNAMDLAVHVCVDDSLGAPAHAGEAFDLLARERRIDQALADRLKGAAGLRNLIVHQYGDLAFDRVLQVIRQDLDDLKRFVAALQ